ncbi:MAG: hypothetical protein V7K69_10840 [Nostoc sp.]
MKNEELLQIIEQAAREKAEAAFVANLNDCVRKAPDIPSVN